MELTDADYSVAVMSGNFTQRGEAAVLDKWTRSRLAVENGVDLVVELPFVFACSRAESFASGAVDILAGLGATHISFGSESGNLEDLQRLAHELVVRKDELQELRKSAMEKGDSYARGNFLAAEQLLGRSMAELMLSPNNILAIEYLKRLICHKEAGRNIKPVTIGRYGSGYFDENPRVGYAGASVLREMAYAGEFSRLRKYAPENVSDALAQVGKSDVYSRMFQFIRAEIVRSSVSRLSEIYCMGEGLENKLKKEIIKAKSYDELISSVVSRRYTEAAVKRLMVYILVGVERSCIHEDGLYARVLAAGERGRRLLKELRKKELSRIPVITNINKAVDISRPVQENLRYDILASDMYNILNDRSLYDFSDRVIKPYIK